MAKVIPTSKKLTIFEGPDGAGKSTAARVYAEETGARYVHFGPLPRVNRGLARMYVEAMLPALLGYQDVVFDRSWLSEIPYGIAFREGSDRLTNGSRRMLERLALRCGAVVVMCDPGWDVIKRNFIGRKGQEMLNNTGQLEQVYELYSKQPTDLPVVNFNYITDLISEIEDATRPEQHPLEIQSAGNAGAQIILVGEDFASHKDTDPLYQWPFASFTGEGCSQWLAHQLDIADCGEDRLMWVNSDQDLSWVLDKQACEDIKVIALGQISANKLESEGITAIEVPHPQMWKRFNNKQQYPLLHHL